MPKGFLQALEAPSHRRVETETRRPCFCVGVTFGVILLLFTIFGVSAWNVFTHRFDKNVFELHSGDEVSMATISDDLSPTFCDGYEVTIAREGEVYLLPHRAKVNETIADIVKITMHQQHGKAYSVRAAYLLEGSIINVTACRENGSFPSPANILLIRGAGNLKKWRENRSCRECELQRVPVFVKDKCGTEASQSANLHFTVDQNAHYFLIIFYGRPLTRRRFHDDGIRLNGTLARTRYDVTDPEEICEDDDRTKPIRCMFNLPWGSDMDVIVHINDLKDSYDKRDVRTRCQARLVFWICIFGAIPVMFTIPISVLFGCFLCRRTTRSFRAVKKLASSHEKTVPIDKEDLIRNEVRVAVIPQDDEDGCMTIQDG